jgi:hypothetical protein
MRRCCATFFKVAMSKRASVNSLPAEDRAAWRRHNLQTLAESSALPFEEKLAILEDLEELTIAMGYERDPNTGRLRKRNSRAKSRDESA